MSVFSSIVIGNESLLVQCADLLLQKGHSIKAVVTRNPEIRSWAEDAGLRVESPGADLAARLGDMTCDWLFSIANLTVIPDDVLAKAKTAVNFHDGPLPAYAGLNAPVWALINREKQHGITWHLMDSGIDEGDILEQRLFEVTSGETALTLNTKCYEAAIESFGTLVSSIESGAVAPVSQDLSKRSYFARTDRPRAAARLDFRRDAEDILALVHGLDHGTYWNPLSCPKIEFDGHVLLVGTAKFADLESDAIPGTVLAVSDADVTVSTGAAPIVLGGVKDNSGKPVALAKLVSVGDVLPSLSQQEAEALTTKIAAVAAVAGGEGHWRKRLAVLDPAEMPLATTATETVAALVDLALPEGLEGERLIAAVGAWAALSAGKTQCDLAYQDAALRAAIVPGYVSPWAPVRFDANDAGFGASVQALAADLAKARKHVGFAYDIIARDTQLEAPVTPDVGVNPDGDTLIDGTCITICSAKLIYDSARLDAKIVAVLADRLQLLASHVADGSADQAKLADLPILPEGERQMILHDWNATQTRADEAACIHQLFEAQVASSPDAVAVVFEDQTLIYADLNKRANQVAHVLADMGVKPGALVGLYTHRSLDLLVGAMAIHKAGGAYVPLDPAYPADRIALYIEDSACPVIIAQSDLAANLPQHKADVLIIDQDTRISAASDVDMDIGVQPDDLAYLIYTSGSTGRPKGVMVEHRNVSNFFTGMDARISHNPPGVWLAVTSLSFDISVLELFYTLARGFKLVLSSDENRALISSGKLALTDRGMDFSLFYWGNDDGIGPKKYELLLEGAKFADQHGFCAVWTPERHFHAFGGPYPNPSVTGAAVAAVTKNLAVRAGSCVAPLHHTARIAEEWAVIDNLTNGRVGLAIASGWQPDDFVLKPENTPPNNKPAMFQAIEDLRKLWGGEAVEFPTKDGKMFPVLTQPRPVSKELPVWVTTAGNPDTWREAGANGCNVLTHLLGQSIDEVADKIKIYHAALREAGHNPTDHKVTLMLHTYVGADREKVRATVFEPMKDYLRSAAGLIKQYAWAFPAFKKPQGVSNPFEIDLGSLSEDEMEGILDFAFERYFEDAGLFGTVEDCAARVEQLKRIDVDEVACLIDYGISVPEVLEGLKPLAEVLKGANAPTEVADDDFSIAAQIIRHDVTHMQCTPSMARMITMNDEARFALSRVKHLMIGGEPLPGALVSDFASITKASIENMYGPTETTIWSSTETAVEGAGVVNIGTPIANTQLYVLDEARNPVPAGVPGELYIGGHGVTRGYWQRDDLTADRFVTDPFIVEDATAPAGARMYRTGDLVRWRADGKIDFFGRVDYQVKLRGHRIELGEIEACLEDIPAVRQAVVAAREDTPGDVRLVGYVVASGPVQDADMRDALAATLPDYMVPAHFVTLDAFPLTPNKKVDRNALPAPSAAAPRPTAQFVAPVNNIEQQIAEIWSRILGVPQIGSKDNFFELGGHSLLAVQAHREIRDALGATSLSITDIFRFPTLGALAGRLDDKPKPVEGEGSVEAGKLAERAQARSDAMSKRRAMRARRSA